jgi:general secretion pathway protein A
MYKEFYGFRENPFGLEPDPKLFFLTEHLKKILDALVREITERKRFILITGRMGAGKTTLIHELMARLNSKIRAIPVYQPCKTFDELLGTVLRELKLSVEKVTKDSMLSQLNEYLLQRSARDESLLIIVDEAQALSQEVMEELRLLCNSDLRKPRLLQEVFLGEPEIQHKLNTKELTQLQQRIESRCQLRPFSEIESRRYIEHRLSRVGRSSFDVFTAKAIDLICRYGQGNPRTINSLSYMALSAGYALSKRTIDASVVKHVCSIFGKQKTRTRQRVESSIDAVINRFESSPVSMRISYALLAYSLLQWIVFRLLILEGT